MNQQFRYRQFPAGNPLANILVVIVGILVISLALTLGFFVFLGVAGFVLFMGVVMSIRSAKPTRSSRVNTTRYGHAAVLATTAET